MDESLQLDYYYGLESEQFSFYRVPRMLVKDPRFKGLSSDAKLLYGLMVDRMSLSRKNGWLDSENRAYIIYTIDNIMDDLGCGKEKAVKILAELDSVKGIGLVEKVRRGQGKPDIIYVKNFATLEKKEALNTDEVSEVGKSDFKKSENRTSRSREIELQEVGKSDFKKSENQTSRSRENRPQEVGKTDPNYNYTSYTNMKYTNPIYPIIQPNDETEKETDGMKEMNLCMEQIRNNIDYEWHMKNDVLGKRELYDELYEVICEIVCIRRPSVRIGGDDYPYELVKSRFMKLTGEHLEYVIECMKETPTKITHIKSYMVTALYNAPTTINHYYQQEAQHDMYGGGWNEENTV